MQTSDDEKRQVHQNYSKGVKYFDHLTRYKSAPVKLYTNKAFKHLTFAKERGYIPAEDKLKELQEWIRTNYVLRAYDEFEDLVECNKGSCSIL